MAKLERKKFKVFGENAPLDEIGQFGSAKATTKKNTKDIEEIQELEAWSEGWGGAVISNKNYPPMEEMTGAMNVMSYQTAYTLQEGIPEWNKDTTYYKGSIVKNLEGEDVKLYQSISNDNLNNPLSNTDNWSEISFGGSGLELCDIGTALYIDETKGLRRYLNGQIVDINTNTQAFLNRLLEIKNTNPDYFTTEANWQSEATLNIDGCVYKFVLNYSGADVVSVRLPKYPDYVEINAGGTLPVVGNGIGIGFTDGTNNFGFSASLDPNITNAFIGNASMYGQSVGSYFAANRAFKNDYTFGLTTDPTKSGIETTLNQTKLKMRYFIQIATGSETENNIINDIELNNPYSLFDSKYSDHELNNLSWLKSEGQWNAKAVYTDAYDKLLKVHNGTETVEGLSVKLSTATDITDYDFVLNTANETFRLPLKTKQKFYDEVAPVVGNGTNIGVVRKVTDISGNGVYGSGQDTNTGTAYWATHPPTPVGITTDPTKSGLETHLTETTLYLYYYVGETAQNANLIDAGRIGEQLANKVDTSNTQWATNACMPDYSAGISITPYNSANNKFTAPCDGIITVAYLSTNTTANLPYINDLQFGSYNEGSFVNHITQPVNKGDTFFCTGFHGFAGSGCNKFYPLKGAN